MNTNKILFAVCLLFASASLSGQTDPELWPEAERSFLQDGPGLLLSEDQRIELMGLDPTSRSEWIQEFLARDPIADTEENELTAAIAARQDLVFREHLSLLDHRARLLFLLGSPAERVNVDCDQTFKPLEIWRYGPEDGGDQLVLYRPSATEPFRLWIPLDSKRALYGSEMEYWLEQWEELKGRIRGRRFDYQICRQARVVDAVTGVSGLFGFAPGRPTNAQLLEFLKPPRDLGQWAHKALVEAETAEATKKLLTGPLELFFPEKKGQRMVARLRLTVPPEAEVEPFVEDEKAEYRLNIEGVVEHQGKIFEDFRIRYQVPRSESDLPVALVLERLLRPDRTFLVRVKVSDEVGGAGVALAKGFRVPTEPEPVAELPVPDEVIVALGDQLAQERIPGKDSLLLIPPETDVVLGLWRADTLVSGESITRVVFLVDGTPQLTRSRPPFTAELRLSKYPTEQVVRVEGYDAEGELVAFDEMVLNQQRGELRVSIVSPPRGRSTAGPALAKAEIVVPEESRVTKVEFLLNGTLQVSLERPPWQAEIVVPATTGSEDITYLTVVAELDDGTRAEDVRFLNVPAYLEQVDVDLVELYTTVIDGSNRLVKGLELQDFTVLEDKRPQEISKFELVVNLPLTLGITIDTSGSMIESLGEARRTAVDFLHNILTPQDRSFAVSFANKPLLLMPRTSDVGAVEEALDDLTAVGATSLYDAVVTSLYYFRGVRGRRALVLLSDGDDTASTIPFRDAMEYARRSGVAIYTIGLNISALSFDVRQKLNELAKETGGRSFYISKATDLAEVYDEIEEELRSQYLLAYTSDRPKTDEEFRSVEVRVKGRYKARTIRGYYP